MPYRIRVYERNIDRDEEMGVETGLDGSSNGNGK